MNTLKPWIQITRPLNALIAALSVFLGAYLSNTPIGLTTALIGFIVALLVMAGNVHNDLCDVEIDRVNNPSRPLVSGSVDPLYARLFFKLAMIVCLIVASGISGLVSAQMAFMVMLVYAYNIVLKRTFLWGNLAVSLLCAWALVLPLPIETWNSLDKLENIPVFWSAVFFAFFMTFYREVLKDAQDIKGDSENECNTLAIRWGELTTAHFCLLLLFSMLFLSLFPALFNWISTPYIVLILVSFFPIGLNNLWKLKTAHSPPWKNLQKSAKTSMILGMVALWAGHFFE